MWNGYWVADPHFWDPDPIRFPNGLAPLSKVAVENGLSLGFWFGPYSSDEAVNWERDADCLIGMWRDYGARHFKIDSLKLHTPKAFARNRRFFEKMLGESSGEMCFDLECTAWAGFVTVCDDGGGYALIFREMNALSSWRLGLREYFRHTKLTAKVLSGEGAVAVSDGVLCADIPHKLGYVWVVLAK